ncbi:hypothetical protein PHMEG_0004886 [Phytophthora megakarya]|uniref:Uncharacterized protein n=1 Tax=Phytophthora megakarya TaxID=4795 RepID=A0A225WUB0_9STRA|nr:hypothetical protein PHMEG_0004886 [Phytophthora megakarya]
MLPSFRHPIDLSAQYGHLETLKFFHDSESEKIQKLWIHAVDPMYYAAKGGQLAVVEWIHANRSEKCGADAMDIAAGYGHLEVVKWLHSNRTEGCTSSAITSAAARGYLDVELMQWFHANYPDLYKHSRAMYEAARYGQLKVIKWLYENIPKIPAYEAIDRAIRSDHIHVAYWLQSRFPNYVVGSSLEFYKPLVYVNTAHTFETLLYLHVHCTDVFTPLFLRNLREDLTRYHRQMIANWLDEHYPSGTEDYGH